MSSLYTYLWTSVRVALSQLIRHKVRSFLTLLGILIGVGAVVAIVSLGEGLRGYFNSQIADQATADMLMIIPDTPIRQGQWQPVTRPFKNRDLHAVQRSEYVAHAIGGNLKYGALVKHGWRSDNVTLRAGPFAFLEMNNLEVEHGRGYLPAEERAAATVTIIGAKLAEELYDPGEKVLGSSMLIDNVRFTVVGILKSRSAMEGGDDINKGLFMPLQTYQKRLLGSDDLFFIAAKLTDVNQMVAAREDIASHMRASRRIRSGADDDFKVSANEDWADFIGNFINTLLLVFGFVAVIALVVGGIGVMNIMLVSVRERTREIGLRKALGATSGNIVWQFLIESVTLTLVGGILGLIAGYMLGGTVALVMKMLWDVFWIPMVPLPWVIAVLGTSVGIGLVFGVYPAWRAGQLDPIVALRYQ